MTWLTHFIFYIVDLIWRRWLDSREKNILKASFSKEKKRNKSSNVTTTDRQNHTVALKKEKLMQWVAIWKQENASEVINYCKKKGPQQIMPVPGIIQCCIKKLKKKLITLITFFLMKYA